MVEPETSPSYSIRYNGGGYLNVCLVKLHTYGTGEFHSTWSILESVPEPVTAAGNVLVPEAPFLPTPNHVAFHSMASQLALQEANLRWKVRFSLPPGATGSNVLSMYHPLVIPSTGFVDQDQFEGNSDLGRALCPW